MAENTHPMSGGSGAGGTILATLKANPVGFFLAAMLLLAVIVPPRKRKYKPKRKYTKRRKKGGSVAKVPGNPGKKKKGKKVHKDYKFLKSKGYGHLVNQPRIKKTTRARRTSGNLPAWRIKGSPEAVARMKKLRGMRKK